MAEAIGVGGVYHSKIPKVKRDKIITEFNNAKTGVLNTVKSSMTGLDVKRSISRNCIMWYFITNTKKTELNALF